MEETRFYIETTYRLNPSVAEELVKSFDDFWGKTHVMTKTAQATLKALKSSTVSPSQKIQTTLDNATLVIPNTMSSNSPRARGRSVD